MYAAGRSPYDFFRGREVLNNDEKNILKAEGPLSYYPLKTFVKWVGSEFGLPVGYYSTRDDRQPMTRFQNLVTKIPVLSRFIKVTSYGLKQQQQEAKGKIQAGKSKLRIQAKDARKAASE
jgi:hypothetical protein